MADEPAKKLKLLWVVTKSPLPSTDGSTHATTTLLSSLTKLGHTIDLIVFERELPQEKLLEIQNVLGVRSVIQLPKKRVAQSYFVRGLFSILSFLEHPKLPLTMIPYNGRRVPKIFEELLLGKTKALRDLGVTGEMSELTPPWNGVVYDGPHGSAHLFDGKRISLPDGFPAVFYRAQNVEGDIWKGKLRETRTSFLKKLLFWQTSLVVEYELALLRKAVATLPVSKEDGERFKELLPRIEQFTVPIGYDFPENFPERSPEPGRFLFIGRLDWEPNKHGLLWLLKEVWPEVIERSPEHTLIIGGRGKGDYLREFSKLPGVTVKGFIEDLEEEYKRADAALAPIFFGSGTRVKVIEASRYGCPTISTELGAQGLGLLTDVSYLGAENVPDWINRLTQPSSELLAGIGAEAFKTVAAHCNPESAALAFSQFVSSKSSETS